jgi:hypothetical protein
VQLKYDIILKKKKINRILNYLKGMRTVVVENAVIKIKYHWVRYKKIKAKRKAKR